MFEFLLSSLQSIFCKNISTTNNISQYNITAKNTMLNSLKRVRVRVIKCSNKKAKIEMSMNINVYSI
jgi:hypothetical protein